MMNPDEAKVVAEVFRRFIDGEGVGSDCKGTSWDIIDDHLENLACLNDEEVHREADIQLYMHNKGKIECGQEFCNQGCFAQVVVDAASYICELYQDTHNLHKNNRYILEHYLALSHSGMIISVPT